MRPKPSCDQRTDTVPKPIRARLRIACTATCGSSAHACTHRSPPERAGSRSSPGKCGRSRSASGLPVGQPEPVPALGVAEEAGSEAEGDRQPARRPGRWPRRCRPAARRRRPRPVRPRRPAAPRVIRSAAVGPGLEQRDQLRAGAGGHVEGREVQPVLRRRDDAGLVLAAEGVRRVPRRPAYRRRRRRTPARDEGAGEPGSGRTAAEQPPAGERPRFAGQVRSSTAAVSCDSGSDRALTASASCLTSLGGQVVVGAEAVALAVRVEQLLQGVEPLVEGLLERGVVLLEHRLEAPRRPSSHRRRWPGSPTGRCATSTPPRR